MKIPKKEKFMDLMRLKISRPKNKNILQKKLIPNLKNHDTKIGIGISIQN